MKPFHAAFKVQYVQNKPDYNGAIVRFYSSGKKQMSAI